MTLEWLRFSIFDFFSLEYSIFFSLKSLKSGCEVENRIFNFLCEEKNFSIGNFQCKKIDEFQFSRYSTSIRFWVVSSKKDEHFFPCFLNIPKKKSKIENRNHSFNFNIKSLDI
jgi:hypothetical protein